MYGRAHVPLDVTAAGRAIRPEVAHACGVLRELGRLYKLGRIDGARWLERVLDVLASVEASLGPRIEASAALAAAARPRVADPANEGAAEHVRRLADRDAAHRASVKGHAA